MYDISLFPVSGQIMSGLVEEMLQTQGAENKVICDILLILAGDYMDKLMDVMMVHYQPNNNLHPVIVTSLANIARLESVLPRINIKKDKIFSRLVNI